MNNNELNKKLSYKQMQESLPDYVFGRLSPEEQAVFESSLPAFPDLQDEVSQVREVFSKVETMDFDRVIEAKTRNLSVRVNDRLNKRKKAGAYAWSMKYAVPTVAVVILFAYMFINKNEINPPQKIHGQITESDPNSANPLNYLSKADAELIFGDGINLDDLHSLYSNNSMGNSLNDIVTLVSDDDKAIDNIYYESLQLKNFKSNDLNSLYNTDGNSMNGIYNELEKLDESEIQSLIEDVKNARI